MSALQDMVKAVHLEQGDPIARPQSTKTVSEVVRKITDMLDQRAGYFSRRIDSLSLAGNSEYAKGARAEALHAAASVRLLILDEVTGK